MKGSNNAWVEVECSDEQDAAIRCAEHIAHVLARRLAANPVATLFVSGGKSPVPLFTRLSSYPLSWDKVSIYLVDERWAPNNPADQNQELVRQHLLQNNAKAANFFPLLTLPGMNDCIQVANRNTASMGAPDIVVLGMGLDGHTASLFPDAADYVHGLTSHEHYVAIQPGAAPYPRISMSMPWLASAKNILLFIPGQEKHDAFRKFVVEEKAESPLRPLLDLCGDRATLFVSER